LIGAPRENNDTAKQSNTPENNEIDNAIASYKRSNQQLMEQVNEQRKQILLLQEKLRKDLNSSPKLVEQRALKEQLEVHIQTIGILVSEKSELQSNITTIQKKLSNKDGEFLELNNQLNGARQRLVEMEKAMVQLKANQNQLQLINREVIQERDRFSEQLYGVNHAKDDLELQNSELQTKLRSKVDECSLLLNQVNELHVKLQKGDLMIHQLSSSSIDPKVIDTWHNEKEELLKTINEQKDIIHRLVSDKAELSQKYNDIEGHYDMQIEQLKNQINLLESEKLQLIERTQNLSISLDNLQDDLEKQASVEMNNTSQSVNKVDDTKSSQEIMELKNDKTTLEQELDVQITENRRLGRVIFEQNEKIEELKLSMNDLTSESVDKSSLLTQLQSDKETISRALQQNKQLKEQLEELQEGFVKMSNNSLDLTSKLESEQHGNKDVADKLSTTQLQLEETKMELTSKSVSCTQLEEELQRFKEELYNVQMKMASKEMDLDLISTELETIRHDTSMKNDNNIGNNLQQNDTLQDKLHEELNSAQDTINILSFQNEELKQTVNQLRDATYNSSETQEDYEDSNSSDDEFVAGVEADHLIVDEVAEEEHARSWDEQSSTDGNDSGYTHDVLQITHAEVAALQTSVNNLQSEREKIIYLLQNEREKAFNAVEKMEEHVELRIQQQLQLRERELQEHFYEQTEALHSKVKSLQEALEVMRKNEDIADFDMMSDGITMPLLKTAFMQLQKKYKTAMDGKATLSDRIEQLEHTNMKLETETETIGEYIALYQTQRQALKTKFSEKDSVISHLSNEHARMQTKVSQLHQLVMQMLSERSGIESKNKQLQELVNRRLALQTGGEGDVSEIPSLEYSLDNLFSNTRLTQDEENELAKDNITVVNERYPTTVSDQTTQQILNIFEQLETTGEGYQHGWLSPAARKHNFQPCANCSGGMIHL